MSAARGKYQLLSQVNQRAACKIHPFFNKPGVLNANKKPSLLDDFKRTNSVSFKDAMTKLRSVINGFQLSEALFLPIDELQKAFDQCEQVKTICLLNEDEYTRTLNCVNDLEKQQLPKGIEKKVSEMIKKFKDTPAIELDLKQFIK